MKRLSALFLSAVLLLGCAESKQQTGSAPEIAAQAAVEAVTATAAVVQADTAAETTAVILALRETVEAITPEPLPPPAVKDHGLDPAVVALVVRWEVGSPAQYARKYERPICPKGYSGPTIGIGGDLGTQTEREIRAAWGHHPDIEVMVTASGQTGPARCKAWLAANRDKVRVSYDDALAVFTTHDWPRYSAMASRAYRNGWDGLTYWHQSSLTSNGYNRGFSFLGSRRIEMREIRDTCVPSSLAPCTAAQLRVSCRVWDSQPDIRKGLCARRYAEADFAVRE